MIKEINNKGTATVFGDGNHEREFIHPFDIYEAIRLWLNKNKEKLLLLQYN